jgi:hypothetical protein
MKADEQDIFKEKIGLLSRLLLWLLLERFDRIQSSLLCIVPADP